MARLNVNPDVEASVAFDVVKPGTYRMRLKEVITQDPATGNPYTSDKGNTCWRAVWEYVYPESLVRLDGQPAKNPGTLRDNGLVIAPAEKQGKLRGLVEALGFAWADLDSEALHGSECDVVVKLETYEGEQRNAIGKYLKPGN